MLVTPRAEKVLKQDGYHCLISPDNKGNAPAMQEHLAKVKMLIYYLTLVFSNTDADIRWFPYPRNF